MEKLWLHKTADTESISLLDMEKKKSQGPSCTGYFKSHFFFSTSRSCQSEITVKMNFHLIKRTCLRWLKYFLKYDPVLKEQIFRLKQDTRKLKAPVQHLAPKTNNAFINDLANNMYQLLVVNIKAAKYFGIMFDSTRITH